MNGCPFRCGYAGPLSPIAVSGIKAFLCPECLALALDGGRLRDARVPESFLNSLRIGIHRICNANSIDPLTQVKNRRFFFTRLKTELRVAADSYVVSLVAFTFDESKLYGQFGARAGDTIVESLAAAFRSFVRESDDFARVESNAFGLIVRNADEQLASKIARRLLDRLPTFFHDHKGKAIPIELTIRVAQAGGEAEQAWTRLLAAPSVPHA